MHAVLALASHHLNEGSVEQHRQTAFHAFRKSLDVSSQTIEDFSMLDTIVILYSLGVSVLLLSLWLLARPQSSGLD